MCLQTVQLRSLSPLNLISICWCEIFCKLFVILAITHKLSYMVKTLLSCHVSHYHTGCCCLMLLNFLCIHIKKI